MMYNASKYTNRYRLLRIIHERRSFSNRSWLRDNTVIMYGVWFDNLYHATIVVKITVTEHLIIVEIAGKVSGIF